MPSAKADPESRLEMILGLNREQARRVVEEVFDALAWDVDEFIVARHAELQAAGECNATIFERIASELGALRFRAPTLTARQIRRRIYG